MTLLSRARRLLSIPLLILFGVAFLTGLLFAGMQSAMRWLYGGCRVHVYYPLVVAQRWVIGEPTWQPLDLMIGMQPTSKRALAIARTHPEVIEMPCPCGGRKCSGSRFLPRTPGLHSMPDGFTPMVDVSFRDVATPEQMDAKAKELARRIKEELFALDRPKAADAFINDDIDEAEGLALAGKDVPPELVLKVVRAVRGTPVILALPPEIPGNGTMASLDK